MGELEKEKEPETENAENVEGGSTCTESTNWKGLNALFAVVFIDLLCVGLVVPLITPLMKELDASPKFIGMLSSVYGFIQLFSGPYLGMLSDRMPRSHVHIMCTIGGAFGYMILGITGSIWMALLSRIVVGVFRQTMTISKAVMADLSVPDDRAKALGFLYTVVSLGFAVGPMLGGIMADKFGTRVPILGACGLFVVNAGVISILIPEKLGRIGASKILESSKPAADTNQKNEGDASKSKEGNINDSPSAVSLGRFASLDPLVRRLMMIRFVIGCSVMLSRSTMGLLMEYGPTELSKSQKGMAFSFFSVVSIIAQTLVVPRLVGLVTEKELVVYSAIAMGVSQVAMAVSATLTAFGISLALIAITSSALKVSMHSILTKAVGNGRFGEVLGVADSVFSVCRAGSPLVAGVLTEYGGSSVPGVVAGFCSAAVAGMSMKLIPSLDKKQKME